MLCLGMLNIIGALCGVVGLRGRGIREPADYLTFYQPYLHCLYPIYTFTRMLVETDYTDYTDYTNTELMVQLWLAIEYPGQF